MPAEHGRPPVTLPLLAVGVHGLWIVRDVGPGLLFGWTALLATLLVVHSRAWRARRRGVVAMSTTALLSLSALTVLAGLGSAPRYSGPESDHFDGREFRNDPPVAVRGLVDLVRWRVTREAVGWDSPPPVVRPVRPEARIPAGVVVTFVGHSTALVQFDGVNVLLDPVWSDRVSPVSWAGPARKTPPGIAFEDLPPIDAVLISHNHYDHLDLSTLRRLHAAYRPLVIAPLGNRALLEESGVPGSVEADWWQELELPSGALATCVPARHFSGRGLLDRNATLWCGFVLRTSAGAVYYAGDTGDGPHFETIRERLGAPALALLPIGAYLPRWMMDGIHVTPHEAVDAHRRLGARRSLAVHFGAFELGDDGPDLAIADLHTALDELGVPREEFIVPTPGETVRLEASRPSEPTAGGDR